MPPTVAQTAGPLLIRYLLNWMLQGVLCAQVYSYYIAFPNDRKLFKVLIYGVFLVETLETGLATNGVFSTFAKGFVDKDSPTKVHLAWLSVPVNSGIVGWVGQLFFASRIKTLSQSWVATSCVVVFAFLTSASALAVGGQLFHVSELNAMPRLLVITTEMWLTFNTTCSIMITSIMSYYLVRQDNKFCPRCQTVLSRITCLFVETGALTAAAAIIDLALYIKSNGTLYFAVPALFITKVYSNTLLVVFNNRMSIIGGRQDVGPNEPSTPVITRMGLRWRRHEVPQDIPQTPALVDAVHVRTEIWTDSISLDRLELRYSTIKACDAPKLELSPIKTPDIDDHIE
ncbi:hypothetical protein BDZ94DRAFT_1235907 [Collybia nuda]|uniref:DUF6534 domain-containing protein n=1 Tax=Collybia nuda TaxID=64659 RepID=A0A9P5Y9X2_9AGAR|nr:hypothetical protein BDZ94DRAFT_1235907 [Collybia nuda]